MRETPGRFVGLLGRIRGASVATLADLGREAAAACSDERTITRAQLELLDLEWNKRRDELARRTVRPFGDDMVGVRTDNLLKRSGITLARALGMSDDELDDVRNSGVVTTRRVRQWADLVNNATGRPRG